MLDLSHKKLKVYEFAMLLLEEVYRLTKLFPPEEIYGLTKQLRKAAVSVCSNTAEGAARISKAEKKRFYEVARSSSVEIDTQFEIAFRLKYVERSHTVDMEKFLEAVFRILSKMISNLDP